MTKPLVLRFAWPALSVAALAVLVVCWIGARPQAAGSAWQWSQRWQPVAPGLSWAVLSGTASQGRVTVTAVRAEGKRWAVRATDRRSVDPAGVTAAQACTEAGAVINAGYFKADHSPVGLLVADGKTLSSPYRRPCHYGDWALFTVRDGVPAIAPLGPSLPDGVDQAIQSAPLLVRDGEIPPLVDVPAAWRAAIGLDDGGRIVLAVAEGGLTLREWAACLHDKLACRDALNLDGGPSAQLAVRGEETHRTLCSTPVPVLLQLKAR